MTDSTNNSRYTLDEEALRTSLANTKLNAWSDALIDAVNERLSNLQHGDLARWQAALNALPDLPITRIDLDHEFGVTVLTDKDIAADEAMKAAADAQTADSVKTPIEQEHAVASEAETSTDHKLRSALEGLKPWRKGPYRISSVSIDTEWRSNWKWNRIFPHITLLQERTVLDVGCGNGYHLWRMRSQGASTVLGIDPSLLFLLQFEALQHYIKDDAVSMLPLAMENLPANMHSFDTVFSMGVLYHRKDPHAHLNELMQSLRPGGELVLETLVSLGEEKTELKIDGRYARMRNIWTLPSVPMLAKWMIDAGFTNIRCVSVDITSRLEQRTTQWMPYESLTESLDPEDLSLTVEGLPRPRRAVMIADTPL